MNEEVIGVSVRGWEPVGSVGDLQIRHLAALTQEGRTRVWVIGCFDNPDHPLAPVGVGGYRSELFALVWQMVRSDVRATLARAKVSLRGKFHRTLQPFHHQGQQCTLGRETSVSPNVIWTAKVRNNMDGCSS